MFSGDQPKRYWTVAESCMQLEDMAADFLVESVDRRETQSRAKEMEAIKRRAAFKLITPKGMQDTFPAIPIGYEKAFFEALEAHQKEMSEIHPA